MEAPQPHEGVLLIGHGTRNAAGQAEFLACAQLLAERCAPLPVEPAFLELRPPDIAGGVAALGRRGVRSIVVQPLLLFSAGHAQSDVPAAVRAALAAWPGVTVRQAGTLDCAPPLVELAVLRAAEGASNLPPLPRAATALVYVGRGSRDGAANAELARFARLRWEAAPTGWLQVAYAAMTQPDVPAALDACARLGFRRVLVQPHLLFAGELCDALADCVRQATRTWPQVEYVLLPRLGAHPLLADAVGLRLRAAGVQIPRRDDA